MKENFGVEQKLANFVLKSPPVLKTESIEVGVGENPIIVEYRPDFKGNDFLNYYQLSLDDLPSALSLVSRQLVENIGTVVTMNDERDSQLFFLSQLKHLNEPAEAVSKCLSNVKNYGKYLGELGLDVNERLMSVLMENFGQYQERYLSRSKMIYGQNQQIIHTGLQPNEVSWMALPNIFGKYFLVDKQVVEIAREYEQNETIRKLVLSYADEQQTEKRFLIHDTSSASLGGIANKQAILSARQLIDSGVEIQSGEFLERVNPKNALFNVHASMSGIGSGNVELKDFDQYIVSLVIDEDAQAETMRKTYTQMGLAENEISHLVDRQLRRLKVFEPINPYEMAHMSKAEIHKLVEKKLIEMKERDVGITPPHYESFLGSKVPLQNVKALAVPHYYFENYQGWTNQNLGDGSCLLVREAAELMNSKKNIMVDNLTKRDLI